MNSNFTIKFNSNPLVTDAFSIQDALTPTQLILIDYTLSTVSGSLLGSTLTETITLTYNFMQNAYNNTNLYVITADYINNEITFEANNENSEFTEQSNNTSGRVVNTINNVTPPVVFTIDTVTIDEASTLPCSNVEITVETTPQATNITSPIIDVVASNPYIFEAQRTGTIDIIMNDSNNSNQFSIFVPELIAADFSTDIVLAPNGGTVTVTNNYQRTPLFTLEYSLDNVNWVLSNSFSGLAEGNYDMYVRDGIGCSFSIPFEITEFAPPVSERVAYTFVSNSQSFRFKIVEDLNTNIPNVTNTLSFQEPVCDPINNYAQPFEKGDGVITSQFRSSYETHDVKYTDCIGNETSVIVDQKTANMDITDVRDGRVISTEYLSQNYVAIQFGSGNTYDPDTLLSNGTYALGNALPDWIDIGEYLNIENAGWIKVIDIIIIDGVSTAVMNSLASSYPEVIPQQGLSRRITSVYDLLPYEVYEFNIDLSGLEGKYQVSIDITDSVFDPVSYLSEYIDVQEEQKRTHFFTWYNTTNNEIYYNSGIRNKARYSYIYNMEWLPNANQDVFLADTNTIQIDSNVREFYLFSLSQVPTAMAQKFTLLCANDRIFADGLNFIKEVESEVVHPNSTNLYQINQQLIRSDYVFDSITSDGSIEVNEGEPLAIDGLGDGLLYIK